ncbi:MAG: hypothetical protein LBI92_01010 [Azoarcus sp.]|nr:hypothetical protein [Azoarcus sp.]
MPQAITSEKLQDYRTAIETGGVGAVGQVYADLYAKGYNYTGWAEGVAKGNSITGLTALHYMGESYYDEHGTILSEAQVDKIRIDMALRTLDEYRRIAVNEGDGILTRDLNYRETKAVHEETFRDNHLSLDNWTLNTPMELIRQKYGDETVERLWGQIRDTGGDGMDAMLVSSSLMVFTTGVAHSENEAARQQAGEWLDNLLSVDVFTAGLEKGVLDSLLSLSDSLDQIGQGIRDLLGGLLNKVMNSIFAAVDLCWGAWENVSTHYLFGGAAPGTPLDEMPVVTESPSGSGTPAAPETLAPDVSTESEGTSASSGNPVGDGDSASPGDPGNGGGSGNWDGSVNWVDSGGSGSWDGSGSSGDSPPGLQVGPGDPVYYAHPTGDDDTPWVFPEVVVTPSGDSPPGVAVDPDGLWSSAHPTGDDDTSWILPEIAVPSTLPGCAPCDWMPSMGGYGDGIGICWDTYNCGDMSCWC